jgi:hypothetical protein
VNPPGGSASADALAERRLQPPGHRIGGLALLALVVGCANGEFASDAPPSGVAAGAVVPDSRDSAGVLIHEYSASDWVTVPAWRLDTTPTVVMDGGEDPEFDLTQAWWLTPVSDGRYLVVSQIPARLLLFDEDGSPLRVVARSGEGPGDVRMPNPLLPLGPDSLLLIDPGLDRVSAIRSDGELLWERRLDGRGFSWCEPPMGPLPGERVVTLTVCGAEVREGEELRPPRGLFVRGFDYDDTSRVATLRGPEHAWGSHFPDARRVVGLRLRYGRWPHAAVWDTLIVSGDGERGFELQVHNADGRLLEVLRVDARRRPVTEAMRQAWIDRDLGNVERDAEHGGHDRSVLEWRARTGPFADSLAPHGPLLRGEDGLLWVMDAPTLADIPWAATAIRRDGALVGRLVGHRAGTPVWFGRDRVIVREVDGDGVVRFGVYALVKGKG